MIGVRRVVGWGVCGVALALAGILPAVGADTPKTDEGKFKLTVQGQSIGNETYKSDETSSVSDAAIAAGGKNFTLHIVTQSKDGVLQQVVTDGGPLGKLTLTVNGAQSKVVVEAGGATTTIAEPLPARVFAYSNYCPNLVGPLIAAYDRPKAGTQSFDVVLVDSVTPTGVATGRGDLVSRGTITQSIGGKDTEVSRFDLTLVGVTLQIGVDPAGRVVSWNVPAQGYVATRE